MRVVRGLCFDLFNTLVNVAEVPAQHGRFTADILGVGRDAWNRACFSQLHEICRPATHLETLRFLAHSIDPAIPEQRILTATQERQQRFDYALSQVEESVLDVLQQLRERGLRLALVSNSSSAEIHAWHRSPLSSCFDTVMFSCDCGARKPDASIYQQALQRLGLSAQECLFVGDGGSDEHRGAYQVGLRPVLLTRHLQKTEIEQIRLASGDYFYAELARLDDIWELLGEELKP